MRNERERPTGVRGEGGFTMVEMVAVIVLLAICLVPLGRVMMRQLRESSDEQRLAISAFLAMEEIEEARSMIHCYSTTDANCRFQSSTTGWPVDGAQTNQYDKYPPGCGYPAPYSEYHCRVDVSPYTTSNHDIREVQVRVWYDTDGDNAWDANEPDVFLETAMGKQSPQ